MAKSTDQLILEANQRLRAGHTGLVIELRKQSLYLRGTLPPKPTSDRTDSHQQRVPTGYLANPAGIQRAEADARIIAGQLIKKEFAWTNHVKIFTPQTAVVSELIERFKVDYLSQNCLSSWQSYYKVAYKWLPQDKPLAEKDIFQVLKKYAKETNSRHKCYLAFNVLLSFADIAIDISGYKSTYSRASVNPKKIPDDKLILEWYRKIPDPRWQFAYGVFATYGLRNHELFHIEWELPNVRVIEGKTNDKFNTRVVYPLHPEWVEKFNLANAVLPTTTRTEHRDEGETAGQYFYRLKMPFTIYGLRHAWAIRNIGYGISDTVAAACMGHAIDVHTKSYQRWMGERDIAAVVSRALSNPNRPLPPS